MMYQVNYKIFSSDEHEHARVFKGKNQNEVEEQFKDYCKGMRLKCDVVSIDKL